MTSRTESGIPPDLPNDLQGAVPNITETQSPSEVPALMLDVHASHGSIHSWKDFAIHIATITIGLLIAIGLEQTIEYLHHRQQAATISGKLRAESHDNLLTVRRDTEACDQTLAALTAIGESLDQRLIAGATGRWMPPVFPETHIYNPSDAEWLIARDSALLQLLPPTLIANYWKIESTREFEYALNLEANRSRVRLKALIDVYAGQAAVSSTDAVAIRLALGEYAQYLRQIKRTLQFIAWLNQIALNDKVIVTGTSPDDGRVEPTR